MPNKRKEIIDSLNEYMLFKLIDILKKTKEYGLIAGIHSTSEQITSLMIEKGFQMVTATSDERLLASGSQNMLKNLKK